MTMKSFGIFGHQEDFIVNFKICADFEI
jgi:hypothetical protein